MTEPKADAFPIPGIPDFWEQLARSRLRLLALDYDGTLAPLREDRMKAFPLEGIVDCLSEIGRDAETKLVIVSGRPIAEILALLGNIGVTMIGSHGWEIREPDGKHHLTPPSETQARRLEQAEQEVAARNLGNRSERKIASLAVHTRGMREVSAVSLEDDLLELWSRDAPSHDLECRRFDGGVELRSAGIDKGTILRDLLPERTGGRFAVYVGDDETDEDAFREIRGRGFGIKVGSASGPTLAEGSLADCEAVLAFLKEWIRVCDVTRT